LRLKPGRDIELVNPEDDPRYRACWEDYQRLMGREGVSPSMAKAALRRSNTLISAMLLRRGDADAMLCGLVGRFDVHLERVREVIGLEPGATTFATMNALLLDDRTLFLADTFVNDEPSAEQLAEIAAMACDELRRFGITPRAAFVSHSMFGSSARPSARRMRRAAELFKALRPGVSCDGEMHGDAALSQDIRRSFLPDSTLDGEANLLLLPNIDAANILFNVLKVTGGHGVTVGPVLLGAARPVHILTPSATVRRVVNMTALAVADANASR
jgi:malate dehydrogenase (oxaloacetate-decarboxylating)(NADP+)